MSNRGKIWKIGSYYTLERENKVGNPEGMVVALNTGASGNNNSTCTINFASAGGSTLFGSDSDNPTATDTTYTGWRHYVISREGTGSNECKLYYNGSLISTGTDGGTHTTPAKFILGIRGYDNTTPFKGRLGLFKLYNKALSATEVLQNYNVTKGRYN